jgi:methionine-rich copper-binding protein CopC
MVNSILLPTMRFWPGALAVLFGFVACAPAWAHAIVVTSTPAAHAAVAGPDIKVEIRFNSRVDAARSRLSLARPDGSTVVLQGTGAGETLTAEATGLAAGSYRLLWQTLSVDGHITRGEIPFEVGR